MLARGSETRERLLGLLSVLPMGLLSGMSTGLPLLGVPTGLLLLGVSTGLLLLALLSGLSSVPPWSGWSVLAWDVATGQDSALLLGRPWWFAGPQLSLWSPSSDHRPQGWWGPLLGRLREAAGFQHVTGSARASALRWGPRWVAE